MNGLSIGIHVYVTAVVKLFVLLLLHHILIHSQEKSDDETHCQLG